MKHNPSVICIPYRASTCGISDQIREFTKPSFHLLAEYWLNIILASGGTVSQGRSFLKNWSDWLSLMIPFYLSYLVQFWHHHWLTQKSANCALELYGEVAAGAAQAFRKWCIWRLALELNGIKVARSSVSSNDHEEVWKDELFHWGCNATFFTSHIEELHADPRRVS